MWERWNSYTKEDGFGSARMNSFSHYAFGAVCQWMFQDLAGIDRLGLGFREIRIRPQIPTPGSNPEHEPIHWVNAHYDSIHGRIEVSWKRVENGLDMVAAIPTNTTALIYIPAPSGAQVTESGTAIAEHPDLVIQGHEGSFVKLEAGSGTDQVSVSVFKRCKQLGLIGLGSSQSVSSNI